MRIVIPENTKLPDGLINGIDGIYDVEGLGGFVRFHVSGGGKNISREEIARQ